MISFCTFSETNIHKKTNSKFYMIMECVNDSFSFKKRVRLTHSFNRTGRGVFGALVGLSVFNTVGFGVFGALVGLSVFNCVGFGVLAAFVGFGVFGTFSFVGFGVFNVVGRGVFGTFSRELRELT